MWFKYYKGYYDVRKLELELVSVGVDRSIFLLHRPFCWHSFHHPSLSKSFSGNHDRFPQPFFRIPIIKVSKFNSSSLLLSPRAFNLATAEMNNSE